MDMVEGYEIVRAFDAPERPFFRFFRPTREGGLASKRFCFFFLSPSFDGTPGGPPPKPPPGAFPMLMVGTGTIAPCGLESP